MDSYRGLAEQFASIAAQDDDPRDFPRSTDEAFAGEDDIGHEPPPARVGQDERRMQVRAYNYWASLLGQRAVPHIRDLTAAGLPDFADHAVMLDFSRGLTDPGVSMLGVTLALECGAGFSVWRLSQVPDRSLLSRISEHYAQILESEAPIGFEAQFVNQRGKTLLYRGILLPFAGDGGHVQHLMAVINWKEVADPTLMAGLRQELEMAAGSWQEPAASVQLPAWADGPAAAEADVPVAAGDLSALVHERGQSRRAKARANGRSAAKAKLADRLRNLPTRPLSELDAGPGEFAVVLIRRLPNGEVAWLGDASPNPQLIDRTARQLFR